MKLTMGAAAMTTLMRQLQGLDRHQNSSDIICFPYLVELVMHERRVVLCCWHGGDEHGGVSIGSHGVRPRASKVERRGSPSVESLLVIGL